MNYGKMLPQLSPDMLCAFLAAADTGSFTSAGHVVHRTQAAISLQMKKLETELNHPLFQREGRGVTLTHEGELFYHFAQRFLELHQEVLTAFDKPPLHGMIRFGAPEDYAAQFLPGTLKRFSSAYPKVQISVACDSSAFLRQQLRNRELDVILTTEDRLDKTDSKELPLEWAVAERGAPVDMRPLPLALYHPGCLYRRNTLAALDGAGIPYRVAYSSPSLAGVLAAVAAGLAVAPVSSGARFPGCRMAGPKEKLPPISPVAIKMTTAADDDTDIVKTFAVFIRQELGLTPL